jgi:N utilization substance protein B
MKILYRYEEGDTNLPNVINAVLSNKTHKDDDKEFCKTLVEKTLNNLAIIDKNIMQVLKNWPYDRVSVIDKIILRLGTSEILYFNDIPPQVSINEAIEISKKYGSSDSSKFINGILDAIKKNHESSDNK